MSDSLSTYIGKKIVDVYGSPSAPFGDDAPVFVLDYLVFEDGTEVYIEAEHDTAYLPATGEIPNIDEETLLKRSHMS